MRKIQVLIGDNMIINNENELEFVKYCQQYLDFKSTMHDFVSTHPDAIRKLWRFFVGRSGKI